MHNVRLSLPYRIALRSCDLVVKLRIHARLHMDDTGASGISRWLLPYRAAEMLVVSLYLTLP